MALVSRAAVVWPLSARRGNTRIVGMSDGRHLVAIFLYFYSSTARTVVPSTSY